jgi:hypothetical protein
MGGFLIGLVIALAVVEYRTSRDIASLIKIIREQSVFIDKLNQSTKDILNTDAELIELCKNLINMLP